MPAPDGIDEDDGVILSLLLPIDEDKIVAVLVIEAKTMREIGRATFRTESVATATFHGTFANKINGRKY